MQKSIAVFMSIILFSQLGNSQDDHRNNYANNWKQVEQFELQGLPKSALEIVNQIYLKAKKDVNKPQLIKALVYQSKFALTLEEDAQLKIIQNLRNEITENSFPTKNILESILADLYWQYFQQNRWQFYNRTHTEEKVDAEDFRTWDLQTIFEETRLHYENSLENGLLLQQEQLAQYDAILHLEKDSKKLRPTLYDLLAHRALEFTKSDEQNLSKPAYQFEITDTAFLSDNETFVKTSISSKDSLSQELFALKIFKNLTLFHLKDQEPDAIIDLTLQRLKYVKDNARFENVDSTYIETLQQLIKEYANKEAVTHVYFELASFYNQQADAYNPQTNESPRWKHKEALAICEEALAKFPKSDGTQNCKALQANIKVPNFSITNESYVPLSQKSKFLVYYKNVEELHFSLLPINQKEFAKFQDIYNDSARIAFINKLKIEKSWNVSLKNENDYQTHSSEIVVPELTSGQYMILATEDGLLTEKSNYAYGFVQATGLVLVENNLQETYLYQVVNRNTGAPISGATVQLKNEAGRYDRSFNKTFTTDNKGFISLSVNDYYSQITATVSKGKDKAYFGGFYLSKNYQKDRKPYNQGQIFLFTDRSIYRPGQTVYFKGIAVAMKENKSEVITDKKIFVNLQDVNYQIVQSLEFKTNAYGSFSGEFVLPSSGLTGNFSINASGNTGLLNKQMNGYTSFSVEEYKRPKFETQFLPVTEAYRVNDSVTVKGYAKAFAGSTITDAKVTFRVYRTAQFAEWYWYRRPSYNSDGMELLQGETTTDAEGNFEITFKALPDLKLDKSSLPIFNYQITADITDLNGETRSTSTNVKVGYHMLSAYISTDFNINKKAKGQQLSVSTTNLNGQPIGTTGTLSIYKVKAPENVLRKRPWPAPDYQLLSKAEFKSYFPHEAYTNEDELYNRPKGEKVFTTKVNTEKSNEVLLKNYAKWESGAYLILFECKDANGQTVKDEKYVTLYSESDNTLADNQLFNIQSDKDTYKPGDEVQLTLGSASKNMAIVVMVEKENSRDTRIVQLNDNLKTISIPVARNDQGGFSVNYYYVNNNAFNSGRFLVKVPYPSTDLSIETQTFRDKLEPGQEETWSFKIKGPKGDGLAAEVLASMYDASLDQFRSHYWSFNPIYHPYSYNYNRVNANASFGTDTFRTFFNYGMPSYHYQGYDQLNWFGFYFSDFDGPLYFSKSEGDLEEVVTVGYGVSKKYKDASEALRGKASGIEVAADEAEMAAPAMESQITDSMEVPQKPLNEEKESLQGIVARKNLQETAFFYPHLTTDEKGNVSFSFTTPESLTKWNLQLLAHTKELFSGAASLSTVTQKELMVLPNPPRFFREGDQITFASKLSNLSDKLLEGVAQIQLFDALTNKDITESLLNTITNSPNGQSGQKAFTLNPKGNTNVSWTLSIPSTVQAIKYRIVAKAGDFTDGEENALPVLSNRMLVTETLPMWVRSGQTKTFTLDKLKNNSSSTLKHHNFTLEVTSNPAWYAVQALPYLMEYPYECAEQTFARYYSNALASHIANSNPRIQEIFNQWKNSDALLSNLEKNQELKSIIIEETPWLRDAQSETEQKKRIALLFDLNKMNNELHSALRKLEQLQMNNGGFPWFKGSRYPNRYITQHIIAGFGHLNKLGVNSNAVEKSVLQKAVSYLDNEILHDYQELEKQARRIRESAKTKTEGVRKEAEFWKRNHTGYTQIHYLYMRSFFADQKLPLKAEKAVSYFTQQAYTFWKDNNLYTKGLVALIAHRNQAQSMAKTITKSLKENAIQNEELGMYWKSNSPSWYWYQAPIETQALMIEVFTEVENDQQAIDELKVWLLKNKQANRWSTTKSTTEAVYALLLQGTDWLEVTDLIDITIGGQKLDPMQLEDTKLEAGTGYFKTSWKGAEIQSQLAEVTLSKTSEGVAWGGLYWQYFEDLDKITSAETPLQLKKKLFLKKNTASGVTLSEITDDTSLQLGDLVRVRIELKVDREMEFIHMKDMRAAGFEPVNVLSQYKWQDGLGYYESTKDVATHFFFDVLPKGVYVFEYDLRVNNKGDFSNGITTIQSMYAPEFSSHSEGVRVMVK